MINYKNLFLNLPRNSVFKIIDSKKLRTIFGNTDCLILEYTSENNETYNFVFPKAYDRFEIGDIIDKETLEDYGGPLPYSVSKAYKLDKRYNEAIKILEENGVEDYLAETFIKINSTNWSVEKIVDSYNKTKQVLDIYGISLLNFCNFAYSNRLKSDHALAIVEQIYNFLSSNVNIYEYIDSNYYEHEIYECGKYRIEEALNRLFGANLLTIGNISPMAYSDSSHAYIALISDIIKTVFEKQYQTNKEITLKNYLNCFFIEKDDDIINFLYKKYVKDFLESNDIKYLSKILGVSENFFEPLLKKINLKDQKYEIVNTLNKIENITYNISAISLMLEEFGVSTTSQKHKEIILKLFNEALNTGKIPNERLFYKFTKNDFLEEAINNILIEDYIIPKEVFEFCNINFNSFFKKYFLLKENKDLENGYVSKRYIQLRNETDKIVEDIKKCFKTSNTINECIHKLYNLKNIDGTNVFNNEIPIEQIANAVYYFFPEVIEEFAKRNNLDIDKLFSYEYLNHNGNSLACDFIRLANNSSLNIMSKYSSEGTINFQYNIGLAFPEKIETFNFLALNENNSENLDLSNIDIKQFVGYVRSDLECKSLSITLNEENYKSFIDCVINQQILKNTKIIINGIEVTENILNVESDGLTRGTKIALIAESIVKNPTQKLDTAYIRTLYKEGHKNYSRYNHDKFFAIYKIKGSLDLPGNYEYLELQNLKDMFKIKNSGHYPKIIEAYALIAYNCKINNQHLVDKFNLKEVSYLLKKDIPWAETVLLTTFFDSNYTHKAAVSDNRYFCLNKLAKCLNRQEDLSEITKCIEFCKWCFNHPKTNEENLKKIFSQIDNIDIQPDDKLCTILKQIDENEAEIEIKNIVSEYDGDFDFEKCKFDLLYSEAQTSKYKSYIMEKDDKRMVMLGKYTCCCQHLGGAGESAMMHGLINPDAGFWVVEDNNGKIVAQAEIWEVDDKTLVFDNIEFADDRSIKDLQEIISKWVQNSKYENIIMGMGYNQLNNLNLPKAPSQKPLLTALEVYILDEDNEFKTVKDAQKALDKGKIDYDDYIYTDADEECVYLKINDITCIPESGKCTRSFLTEQIKTKISKEIPSDLDLNGIIKSLTNNDSKNNKQYIKDDILDKQ